MAKPANGFDKRPEDINRTGRPVSYFNGLLREMGETISKKTGKKYKELVIKRIWVDAINGDLSAIREVIDRIDGKSKESTDITSDGQKIENLIIYRPQRGDEVIDKEEDKIEDE